MSRVGRPGDPNRRGKSFHTENPNDSRKLWTQCCEGLYRDGIDASTEKHIRDRVSGGECVIGRSRRVVLGDVRQTWKYRVRYVSYVRCLGQIFLLRVLKSVWERQILNVAANQKRGAHTKKYSPSKPTHKSITTTNTLPHTR